MAHKKVPSKGLSYMEKKAPVNPKYADVKGKLNTGMTVDKVKYVSSQQFRKRQDEIFFRLKKEQLYSLYCEYEADDYEDIAENEISESGPHIVTHSQDAKPNYEKPYLILDVRDQDAFLEFHLMQSRSFPYVNLRQDRVHPELAKFKNKEAHLIIVVCDDERRGSEAAKILVDRGADNVFLLSCNVVDFAQEYPAFAEGDVPAPKKSSSRTQSRAGTSSSSSSSYSQVKREMDSVGSGKTTGRSGYSERHTSGAATTLTSLRLPPEDKRGRGTHRSDNRSNYSNSTTGSVAESVISRSAMQKGKF